MLALAQALWLAPALVGAAEICAWSETEARQAVQQLVVRAVAELEASAPAELRAPIVRAEAGLAVSAAKVHGWLAESLGAAKGWRLLAAADESPADLVSVLSFGALHGCPSVSLIVLEPSTAVVAFAGQVELGRANPCALDAATLRSSFDHLAHQALETPELTSLASSLGRKLQVRLSGVKGLPVASPADTAVTVALFQQPGLVVLAGVVEREAARAEQDRGLGGSTAEGWPRLGDEHAPDLLALARVEKRPGKPGYELYELTLGFASPKGAKSLGQRSMPLDLACTAP